MDKKQVLKQRAKTGILFSIIVVLLIFAGKYGMALLGLTIAVVGSVEMSKMIMPNRPNLRVASVLTVVLTIFLLMFVMPDNTLYRWVLALSILFVLGLILHIFIPFIDFVRHYFVVLIVYLGLPLGLFISFVLNSPIYCPIFWLTVIALIWLIDSLAYLVGSRIGKTKLFERISPKKTWEGFLGAGLLTVPLAWMAGELFLTDPTKFYFVSDWCVQNSGLFMAILSVIIWITGTLGDLFESCIKRNFGVKDSGSFMPGHGGILDRFDSFIFILPFVLLLLQIF